MALTKILNDENKSFQPVLTDKLVYDTKPTVNSFNGITSDAVARAIAGASGEVPAVTESDNGKVLTAVYDEGGAAVEWSDAASGVPAATESDEGKVLGVTNNQGSVGWVSQTPAQVNSDWNAASGAAQILNKPSLAAVATSGSYDDLSGKPTIPAAQVNSDWNAASGVAQILNKPSLATVATSGSYADLSNKPTIPTVDQSYSASSTNAQSGTAVAGALATINQVPASTSADEDKVLTVNASGNAVWADAQGGGGGGSSYTFSAPLRESAGTVVLDVDTDELDIAQKTTSLTAQRSISAAESGYAWYLGTLVQDTSDTVYTFTFNNVPVPDAVGPSVIAQGKHIYPMLVGETYGSWGNQWIIPTALTFNGNNNTVSGSFDVCFKSGESDYPTHLDSYGQLSWASVLVLVVSADVPAAQVSSSSIYGSTTSESTVSYNTGSEHILMVKHPVPAVNFADNGKVLKATYSYGVGTFGWADAPTGLPATLGTAGQVLTVNSGATGVEWANAPTELPASLGTAGQVLTVNSGATGIEWATPSAGVEFITVTSVALSNARSLYESVNNAVSAGKLPVLVTANSSNSKIARYWYLYDTNSWDSLSKWYLFRCMQTLRDQSTSTYSYIVNELNVGRSTSSDYGIECHSFTAASGLTKTTLNPFNA